MPGGPYNNTDNPNPHGNHPGGRPPKWQDPEKLKAAIDAYFADCDTRIITKKVVQKGEIVEVPTPLPYTVIGLANALGVDRRTINNYRESDKFFPIIASARARIEEQNLAMGLIGAHDSRIAALNLASNYGYSEKSSQEDPQEARAKLLVELVQALPPDLISALRGRLMGEIAGRKLIDITPEGGENED